MIPVRFNGLPTVINTYPQPGPALHGRICPGVTIYLSGPISGGGSLDEQKIAENVAAFTAAAATLRAAGHHVVSPVEIGGDDQPRHVRRSWREYMVPALHALLDCDRVVLLPGWQHSVGACLEWYVADQLGMPVEEWVGEVSP